LTPEIVQRHQQRCGKLVCFLLDPRPVAAYDGILIAINPAIIRRVVLDYLPVQDVMTELVTNRECASAGRAKKIRRQGAGPRLQKQKDPDQQTCCKCPKAQCAS
jgi:hypothetical protein